MENTEASGGTRYSSGKPGFWWCVPLYGLRLIARVTEAGSKKYAPLDWQEGQSFSTLMDCAMRHMIEVMHRGPWAVDEDTGAYHLAAVGWNVLCLLTFMELGRHDLDDVTKWRGVTSAQKKAMESESTTWGIDETPTWAEREEEVACTTDRIPCCTPGCQCHRGDSLTKPAHPATKRGAASTPGCDGHGNPRSMSPGAQRIRSFHNTGGGS